MKQRILFVDDEIAVLDSYRRNLYDANADWVMEFESSPQKALNTLQATRFDAVTLDYRMPAMSGLELLQRMQDDPKLRDVPVILVTGEGDATLKRRALALGATDLLDKPVNRDDLIARITNALRIKQYQDDLINHNQKLEREVAHRSAQLEASRKEIIWKLARAAEFRDEDTGNHVIRVGYYSRLIAEQMGLAHVDTSNLFLAAPLHDIGKIGIPDSVLLKPGKLSPNEWAVMKQHTTIGDSILREDSKMRLAWERWNQGHIAVESSPEFPVLEMAATIAKSHHEKWNGSGYPNGIAGDAIPIEARIVAVADVFDALRSRRPYKEPMPIERAIEIILDGRESHFAPDANDAFFDVLDEIIKIEQSLSDDSYGSSITQLYQLSLK